MEAVAGLEDRRRRADAPAAETHAGFNPYANGYMGDANGTQRTAALWKRNRVTPINSRDSAILNFAPTQEAR